MISRSQRISTGQFETIMKQGRVAHSPLFLVRWIQNTEDTRVAVAVPKKIVKTAVLRNKIRRRTYDAVRQIMTKVAHSHVVLIAKHTALEATRNVITEDITKVFGKNHIIR